MLKLDGVCWVITDGAAGNQRQALALAQTLDMPIHHLQLEPRAPWSWLAPRLGLGARFALSETQRRQFAPPWPTIAIGCGRTSALYTRLLRPMSHGRCYTVQILDPRVEPSHWDTVIAPQHDELEGPNVLHPLGSLNPIDDAWLEDARDANPALVDLPRPRVGVLLGGPRKGIALDAAYTEELAAKLLERQRAEGGSLLVLASRRTPPVLVDVLRKRLDGVPGLFWANPDDGSNPYQSVLGWADRLVVTPDSVNMLSEACAVGCPVHTLVTSPLPAKLERFHHALRDAGRLHSMEALAEPPQHPLRETAAMAATLRERIASHRAAPP